MTNILFVVRVRKRPEADPGYSVRRLRDQAGEIVDWLPDGMHPGNAIIDNPEYRIIQVTGAGMTETIAASVCAMDQLGPQDIGKNFLPRLKIWKLDYTLLPLAVLNALKVKIPFAIRGTIYDASYTLAQVNNVLRRKVDEPRNGQGLPTDDGETLVDLS